MNRKTGVILSYLLMIFEVLSTLLLTPFIIRTLGQAEYGVYRLSAVVNGYLLLLDLGIGNAIVRYVAKFKEEGNILQGRRFFGVATVFYLLIAVLAVIGGILLILIFPSAFAKGLTSEEIILGQKLLSITMINSAVTLGTAVYANILIAYERFTISKGSSIVQIILRMILTYVALRMGLGSIGIVTVNLIMTILCRGFFIWYVFIKIKLRPMFQGIKISFIKEIVMYSSLILLQTVATTLNSSVDQILLGALVSSSSIIIAVYGIGTQIAQYYQSMGSAFTGILMPGIVRMVEHKADAKTLTDEMVRVGRIIFMVLALILVCFILYGKQFVVLWAGEENLQGYYVTVILMAAYLLIYTESIGSQILWAMNEHKEQAILKISIVVLNIFLTVVLIRWNPLFGATIGTFLSLMAGDVVVMNIIFVKKIGIRLRYYYTHLLKGILPCLIISLCAGFFFRLLDLSGWFGFCLNVAVVCVIYAGMMWRIGLNDYEKNLILSAMRKFRKKTR